MANMRNNKFSPPDTTSQEWREQRSKLVVEVQGKLVSVKHQFPKATQSVGAKRGDVSHFTQASRLRLLKHLARFDWEGIDHSLFVTLTYPDEQATQSQEDRNRQRYIFHRALEISFKRKIPALWRIEWLPRLSGPMVGEVCPHWHYLLFGERFIPHAEINTRWKSAIGREGYCRTEVQAARKEDAVGMYISKYLSKDAVSSSLVYAAYHNIKGRHWGLLRPKMIPRCERQFHADLTPEQESFLMQFAGERLAHFPSEGRESFSMLGQNAVDLKKEFETIRLGDPETIG